MCLQLSVGRWTHVSLGHCLHSIWEERYMFITACWKEVTVSAFFGFDFGGSTVFFPTYIFHLISNITPHPPTSGHGD